MFLERENSMKFRHHIIIVLLLSNFNLYASKAANPCPVDAELWVAAGQSNMQGCGKIKKQLPVNEKIWMFNVDNTWMHAQIPTHRMYEAKAAVHKNLFLSSGQTDEQLEKLRQQSKENPIGGTGPDYFFAECLAKELDKPIAIIPSAHGGTSMDQWSPNLKDKGDESLYGAMLNRIKMVGSNIKGIIWYQGESDAFLDPNGYKQKMLNFIDSVRSDVNNPQLPIIYVQIGLVFTADEKVSIGWEKVRESQRQILTERKNIYMTTAIDLTLDNPIHASYEAQQQLGKRLAQLALTYAYKKDGFGGQIDVESIKYQVPDDNEPAIKIKFSGVKGKLISYGKPNGFLLRSNGSPVSYRLIYRIEFIANEPSSLLLKLCGPLTKGTQLLYGDGCSPYLNITDEKDMPIPAFGPLDISF
jgi:hypothetical protein